MYLTIVLRKEVPDTETAQALLTFVADKVSPYEGISVTGTVNEPLSIPPEPE